MTSRAFYFVGAIVLVFAVCEHLFFVDRGFYSIGWDESGRTLDAYTWAAHGIGASKAWLPFYRICVGLGLRAHPDLVVTPRIISFSFGLGSIVAAAWLAQELFQGRTTTLLTLTLGAFCSQRVALSLAPLSDIMFVFVMLVTMALLARWLRTDGRTALFACALFAALATTIRYEGWISAAAVAVIVAGRSRFASTAMKRKDLVAVGAIVFTFAAAWSVSTFPETNPIGAVIVDARRLSPAQILRKNPLVELAVTNALSLNLIGIVAILHFTRRGPWRHRAIIAASFGPLLVASLVLLLTRSAQTGPSWRMIGVWTMLLLPFTAWVLAGGDRPAAEDGKGKALAIAATMLVLAAFVFDTFRIERDSSWAFPESDRLAGRYLDGLLTAKPEARVLIESSRYFFLNVQVASQHPDAFVTNSVPERESTSLLPLGGRVRQALEGREIELLVFRTDEYRDFLNRSPEVTKLGDFGPWSIYAVRR
ncbi:MAG TPA: hypothetical protein VL049_06905 [Candidatus Dormibacteraeota bacterium]|nr:hypothetical protein [Candidatus Dormibacteraeota bacterium]